MKELKIVPLILVAAFVFLFSCDEENHCNTTDYAQPELSILEPADGVIVVPWEWPPVFVTLNCKAEAGLNTLKFVDSYSYDQEDPWEQDIHLFSDGKNESTISFQLPYVYEGRNTFVLYDLCDQRTELKVTVVFEQPPAR
jgi:hypothetical protein